MLRINVLQTCLVSAVTVQTELGDYRVADTAMQGTMPEDELEDEAEDDEEDETDDEAKQDKTKKRKKKKKKKTKRRRKNKGEEGEEESMIGIVEVFWKGKVEKVCFPLPFQMKYLSKKTKKQFLHEVDLSTNDKRVTELLDNVDGFMTEMELIYNMAEQSSTFRFLNTNMPSFKIGIYFVVVLLNINIIMSPLATPAFSRVWSKCLS